MKNSNDHKFRKKAEAQLLLQQIIDSSPTPFFSLDRHYQYTSFNQAHARGMKEIYGADIELGHSLYEYQTVSEDRIKSKFNLDRALGGEQFVEEAYSGRPDLSRLYIEVTHNPIQDEQGRVIGVAVYTQDISKRKQAEEDLKKNKRFLEVVFNAIQDGITVMDPELNILSANEQMKKWYPHQHPFEGKKCYTAFQGRTEPCEDCPAARSLKSGKPEMEEVSLKKNGAEAGTLQVYAFPILDDNGNASGIVEYIRDITKRKDAEAKLLESEEKYHSLVEQSADMMYLHDLRGNFVDVNQASVSGTGYSRQELLEMNVFDLHPDKAFHDEIVGQWKQMQVGQPVTLETTHVRKDGRTFTVEIKAGKIRFSSKDYILALVRDITRRKRMEKALHDQLAFEKMVSDISTRFMRLPSKRIEEGINHALRKTGKLFDFDFSYLFVFSDDMKTVRITHEWSAAGGETKGDKQLIFRTDTLPWLAWRIRMEDYVHISDVSDLPPEAEAEKNAFNSQNIRSLLCVSLIKNGTLFGFLGFGAKKEKKWTENYTVLLKIVAELISSAFARGIADEKIRHLSFYDQLTGLYNRLYLEEEMQRLDTERQLPISIIMSDLNGLKLINDTYGHAIGDEALRSAGRILTRSCRKEDIIARWGGDEFMILLPGAAEKEVNTIARRINEICRGTYVKGVPVSMALGYAVKDHAEMDLGSILKTADDMMYKQKLAESRSTKSSVLNALLKTLGEKSFETESHARNMQKMALKIGQKINLSSSELNRLSLLVTLHDIGKIKISEEILTKKGDLTVEEWQVIKEHPKTGYRIALATEEFAHVAHDILCHHEHHDGRGYPQGLKGKEKPLLARIASIADAWEVMSHGRPYRKSLPPEEIASEFKRCAGTQFDPELVEVFLSILNEEEKEEEPVH